MGGEANIIGLSRYRSAPATWLEALLESDIESNNNLVLLKPTNTTTHDIFSTPEDFVESDSYFSTYQMSGDDNYDFTRSNSSSSKRPRENDSFSSQLKEEQSEHLERGLSGLLDPEMEKLLEDSVPCRVRAKRGCATHPRSITVRRTRISDRIRKLQELVPNMERQTNTADMLEEAVEYVKLLQKQIQELTEQQKNCKCVHNE